MVSESKIAAVTEIKERLGGVSSLVLADYRGLSVKEMQDLRRRLRESGCEITIYKNRLSKIALADLEISELDEYLVGPTAFVLSDEDPASLAKTLMDFAKEHEALEVKVAYIDAAVMSADEVRTLATLPAREELIAKLLGTMQNPMAGLVRVANGPASAFVRILGAIKDQKTAA